jgi:hypothetical protein
VPGAASATPPVLPVKEPEMKPIRAGIFTMGSNDDVTEKPLHR